MSTRCHVIISDSNSKFYVYHHCDGYPEGVGSELKEILSMFNDLVNVDTPKGLADYLNKFSGQYEDENCGLHGDEEYVYTIDLTVRTLTCYKVPFDVEEDKLDSCKTEFTYKF